MTQEEKDILLKDLCGRLPYGVKAVILNREDIRKVITISVGNISYIPELGVGWFKECKPYLFPISSMTEEQKEEFDQLLELELKALNDEIDHTYATIFEVDFYNKHHLDWRGLIPRGLAIDATGLNIY